MAPSLYDQISQLQSDVRASQQAISLVENPPPADLPLDRSKLDVLSRLERVLNQASDESDRAKRLQLAKDALLQTQSELATLESEASELEAVKASFDQARLEFIDEYNAAIAAVEALATAYQERVTANASQIKKLTGSAPEQIFPPRLARAHRSGSGAVFL